MSVVATLTWQPQDFEGLLLFEFRSNFLYWALWLASRVLEYFTLTS